GAVSAAPICVRCAGHVPPGVQTRNSAAQVRGAVTPRSPDMDALRPTTDPQTNSQSSAVILIVHCHLPMLQCNIAVMRLSRSAQPMPYGDSYEEPLRLLPWQVRSGAVS